MAGFMRGLYSMSNAVSGASRWLLVALFAVMLAAHVRLASEGWTHAIRDRHTFRQTQTAYATRSLLQGAPLIAYEVPVHGKPWAVPIEFPMYQAVVAAIVRSTGLALEPAGRAVSLVAFYLALAAVYAALRFVVRDPSVRLIPICFVLASPLYIF